MAQHPSPHAIRWALGARLKNAKIIRGYPPDTFTIIDESATATTVRQTTRRGAKLSFGKGDDALQQVIEVAYMQLLLLIGEVRGRNWMKRGTPYAMISDIEFDPRNGMWVVCFGVWFAEEEEEPQEQEN